MKKAIKTQEYKALLNYMKNDRKTRKKTLDKYKKILTFLYYTGVRINEVCKLKGEDIIQIIDTRKVKIETSKTKRFKDGGSRLVFFTAQGVADIKAAFYDTIDHPDGYCIRAWGNKNKQVNITSLTNSFNRYIQKALGSEEFGSHSFRRGLITEMIIDKQTNPETVQKFIGHRNYETTSRYVDPTNEDIQRSLIR